MRWRGIKEHKCISFLVAYQEWSLWIYSQIMMSRAGTHWKRIGLFWYVTPMCGYWQPGFPSCQNMGFQYQKTPKKPSARAHSQEMEVGQPNFGKLWKSKLERLCAVTATHSKTFFAATIQASKSKKWHSSLSRIQVAHEIWASWISLQVNSKAGLPWRYREGTKRRNVVLPNLPRLMLRETSSIKRPRCL